MEFRVEPGPKLVMVGEVKASPKKGGSRGELGVLEWMGARLGWAGQTREGYCSCWCTCHPQA